MIKRRISPSKYAMVTTSDEVANQGFRVTRMIRSSQGDWTCISAAEADESEPILVHFSHLLESDSSLIKVRLRKGEYALRTFTGTKWHYFGPIGDKDINDYLESGFLAAQQEEIYRAEK